MITEKFTRYATALVVASHAFGATAAEVAQSKWMKPSQAASFFNKKINDKAKLTGVKCKDSGKSSPKNIDQLALVQFTYTPSKGGSVVTFKVDKGTQHSYKVYNTKSGITFSCGLY